MKPLTVYECEWCKKLFRTPDRHQCKKNPALKNCFSCKHLRGWDEYKPEPPAPDCAAGCCEDWDIDNIKWRNYDMQCEGWEEGKYDWMDPNGDRRIRVID
ncbi:MAG: hypothetical protein QME44_04530 [Thermodesulfobacteriota bacterium]|nr:hypothetical protein [Thermodesulfobacteriota bacterium]